MKKAGECSESMKFCHSELQDLSLALVRIADDPERDIRLEVRLCCSSAFLGIPLYFRFGRFRSRLQYCSLNRFTTLKSLEEHHSEEYFRLSNFV